MGVPKFYRFISDRYPCINKIIKGHEIPCYDNLYLDMNSIIHTCSHPTDSDVHFRIGKKEFSDEDIFLNVSRYVELIFCIVKPAKVMYLAFDGVAPRAKMNQQRANRFRVAKENNKAFEDKEILRDDVLFDANCITPGTIFMTELIDHIKHFIAYKISNDPFWQKCKIILSGSEVPGEGEHKIMQFIRYNKAQPHYNHNTRHCLYSLDADLIMLGLCTHEPHFSLLRENVAFGKAKKMLTPEESDFTLLHLSLVREYLEYEFTSVKSKLKFDFDLEKIIDDWVLIGFLVGNDFIPQLPNLHIVKGALPFLYKAYIEILPTLDGYINEAGILNIIRFEKFMQSLPFIEQKLFASTELNEVYMPIFEIDFEKLNIKLENHNTKSVDYFNTSSENKTKVLKEVDFQFQKEQYYKNKLKFDHVDESLVRELVDQYIRAIQWTLNYYYHECSSWSWYYPYHYAPFISDIKNLQKANLKFDMAKPFLPLQHLVAVLPPANSHLLPKPLQCLLTNPKSPIIDFYPENFEIDLNGKTNDWEAIVLIPFIDEDKLINAIEPYLQRLNMKERKRNVNGMACSFTYTDTSLGQYPVDTAFDPFINHAQLEHIKPEDMLLAKDKLIKGLCQRVSFDLSFPGFPTFKHVPHSYGFEIKVTNTNSNKLTKIETMILNVTSKHTYDLEEIAKQLLGQTVYINWPHLQEAHVIGVTDFTNKIFLQNFWKKYNADNLKYDKLSKSMKMALQKEKASITDVYKNCLGINIGETKVLVYAFPMMGKRYICGNQGKIQLQTKWSSLSQIFPYQLIVKEIKLQSATTFLLYKSVTDIFTVSSPCFVIGHPNYGSMAQVKNVISNKQHVAVSLKVSGEPDISQSTEDFFITDTDYMSCHLVAKKLNVSSLLISRITGSLILTEDESDGSKFFDIGLCLKLPKHDKELIGYTQKKNDAWFYSSKTIKLIQLYIEKFPDIFANINKNPTSSTFRISDIFPEGINKLNDVKSWLAEQAVSYTTFLECGTKTLGVGGVPKLEKFVSDFLSKRQEPQIVNTKIPFQLLFKPGTIIGLVPPDVKAQHKLLDRIICIKNNFTVPLGLKGTIIGIQEKEEKWKNVYEILFDSSFTGGLTLYGSSEHKCYRLTVADFVNISFGQRDQNVSLKPKNHNANSKTTMRMSPRTSGCNKFDKTTKVTKVIDTTNNKVMPNNDSINVQNTNENKIMSPKIEKTLKGADSNKNKTFKVTLPNRNFNQSYTRNKKFTKKTPSPKQ